MIICILNEFDRKLLLYFKQNYCWRRELGTAWVLPPKHGHGGRILRPESMLHFLCQVRRKTTPAAAQGIQDLVPRRSSSLHWELWGVQATGTVWESCLCVKAQSNSEIMSVVFISEVKHKH